MTALFEKNKFMSNLSNYLCGVYGLDESKMRIFNEETELAPDISSVSFCKAFVNTSYRKFNDLAEKVNDFAKSEKLESELLSSESKGNHLKVMFEDKKYLLSFYVGGGDKDSVSVMFVPALVPSVGLDFSN